jgi:hypothetical protein
VQILRERCNRSSRNAEVADRTGDLKGATRFLIPRPLESLNGSDVANVNLSARHFADTLDFGRVHQLRMLNSKSELEFRVRPLRPRRSKSNRPRSHILVPPASVHAEPLSPGNPLSHRKNDSLIDLLLQLRTESAFIPNPFNAPAKSELLGCGVQDGPSYCLRRCAFESELRRDNDWLFVLHCHRLDLELKNAGSFGNRRGAVNHICRRTRKNYGCWCGRIIVRENYRCHKILSANNLCRFEEQAARIIFHGRECARPVVQIR